MSALALPKLVSIDLDGTLIDSVPDLAWSVDRCMEAMGLQPSGETKVRHWVGNGALMLLRRALSDARAEGTVHEEEVNHALALFKKYYAERLAVDSRVYDGVFDALNWLTKQGIPLALITNKPIAFAEPILVKLDLAPFFKWTLGGDSLEKSKPDPMPLTHIAHTAGVAVAQCLHIGDSSTDIEAAKSAGFSSIAVSFGYNYGQPISASAPDAIIDHWGELSAVLKH